MCQAIIQLRIFGPVHRPSIDPILVISESVIAKDKRVSRPTKYQDCPLFGVNFFAITWFGL